MGLLSALGGLIPMMGEQVGFGGLIPTLLQGGGNKPDGGGPQRPQILPTSFGPQPTMPQMPGGPPLVTPFGQGVPPPSAPMGGGMMGAFGNDPQFQAQLGAIMRGAGPGHQPVPMTPPTQPMSTGPNANTNLWNDGIPGNARAAGIPRPGMGRLGGMNAMGLQQQPLGSFQRFGPLGGFGRG